VQSTVPTIRAVVSFPPGINETRLAVFDQGQQVAQHVWRPSDNYAPGPATWDWRLNALGYERRSPWRPDEFGFGCNVEPIIRAPGMVPGS
jgi:hypothetical protein